MTSPALTPICLRSFPDVAERLASAHLVIARAGASTVAELAIAGRPSILVPLPGAIDDHQTANARALVEARGASMIAQRDLTPADAARPARCIVGSAGVAEPCRSRRAHDRAAGRRARLADLVEELMPQEAKPDRPSVMAGFIPAIDLGTGRPS